MRRRELAAAVAGPLLIVGSILVLLHGFLLGRMNLQHVDPLAFFLPTHCFLGEHLARGDIPLWNPHVLAGAPFAADPQSGWMYLPVMALYALAPCELALPWLVTLNPVLAGLGAYWFLRGEGLSRPAATLGGLVLGLGIASSRIAVTLPFAGSLAWSALMLAAASRCFRAQRTSGRIGWALAVAACWGQVAAAHLSHGLVIATGALVAYGLARSIADRRAGRERWEVWRTGGLVAVLLPLVNLAFLLPRLAYLPRTSLALGYDGMERLSAELAGRAAEPFAVGAAVSPPWILGFATSPGAYLGIGTLTLAALAWRLPRTRPLVAGLSAFAALCYLLSLQVVADAVHRFLSWMPFSDFYVHEPARFRYGVFLVLPLLAAAGFDGWREAPTRWRALGVAGAAWLVAPLLAGADAARLALPLAGAAVAAGSLWVVARRPALAAVVPAVVAVELVASGFAGQAREQRLRPGGDPPLVNVPFTHLVRPTVDVATYRAAGPLARRIARSRARHASFAPSLLTERGYLEAQQPEHWGLLANQRAMLLGLEDAGGYNPSQLLGTWMFLRASSAKDMKYNAAFLGPGDLWPSAQELWRADLGPALDLLDVRWIVAPPTVSPLPAREVVAHAGWRLLRVDAGPGRATLETRWNVVGEQRRAIELAASPFSGKQVALEQDPGIAPPPGAPPTPVTYRAVSPEQVRVTARGPGVVLIRNAHDPGWRATVNGRATPVLRAEGFLQAVAIGSGRAVIDLRYEDPWVSRGLWGSGLVVVLLGAGALARRRRDAAGRDPRDRTGGGGRGDDEPPDAVGERLA